MAWFKIGCITLTLRSNDNDDGDDDVDDDDNDDGDDDYDASYDRMMYNMGMSRIFILTLKSNFTSHT